MSKKRVVLKRRMAQAYVHQMRTIEILLEVAKIFGEWHKDYEEMFILIATMCGYTMSLIKKVCTHSWGYFPDDVQTWLK